MRRSGTSPISKIGDACLANIGPTLLLSDAGEKTREEDGDEADIEVPDAVESTFEELFDALQDKVLFTSPNVMLA